MANYKLKYAGEKIDELLTKIDELGTGSASAAGNVKLSDATNSTSGVNDGVAATPSAIKSVNDSLKTTSDEVTKNSEKLVDIKKKLVDIKKKVAYYIGYDSQNMITLFKESE